MKSLLPIILVLLILVAPGCSDFLDQEPKGRYSSETFWKSQAQAELALVGLYNAAAFSNSNNSLWLFGDVTSDDAITGGNPGDFTEAVFIDQFTYTNSNTYLEQIWRFYYEGVSRANNILYYVPSIAMDEEDRDRILAEAKFMRAYFYFNLVNIFGEIPLRLQPLLSANDVYVSKTSVENIYAQIEQDLLDAKSSLPKRVVGLSVGHATRGAAWGLLSKTYLYQEKWGDALVAADSVIALGQYELQSVYKNNFIDSTQNNSESVFEIQHTSRESGIGNFMSQFFTPTIFGGYGVDLPTEDFVNEFETASDGVTPDPRLRYTVLLEDDPWVNGESYDPDWSVTGFVSHKQVQPLSVGPVNGDGALNYVYMRYADVLLMRAEALNELGRTAEALVPLNAVRKRARESYLYDEGLPGYGAVPAGLLADVVSTDEDDVRLAIRHERRVELGFEFHRFFDLMRYGSAAAEEALEDVDAFSYSEHRYFPIPQLEIDTNPGVNN